MQAEADLIILGGGCAGLSLAMRLAGLGARCPRTLILERRTSYADDRTWCFWGDGSTRLRHLIRQSWQTMALRAGGRVVVVDCGATPYQMLPARSFYAEALDAIGRTERIELVLGASVSAEPRRFGDIWRIETSAGPRHGGMVIDTRPERPPERGGALLWQSFYGHEIACDAAVFDPARIDLMDFARGDPEQVRFTYVLPVSPHRALVEVTIFAADPLAPSRLAGDLEAAISQRVAGAGFTIVRSENGILPMGLPAAESCRDGYVRVGLTAGGARPSTGYAFQRIQRWADACAKAIRDGRPPIGHARDGLLIRAMDQLLLAVIRARPEAAPALFLSLFEKTDTPRIIRFMSDRGSLADYLAVVLALPVLPFLREIPAAVMTTIRRRVPGLP